MAVQDTQYPGMVLQRSASQPGTAMLVLDNPPAHTWTPESLAALTEVIAVLNADPDVRALVITGNGDKFFSAGADLKLFAQGDKAVAATMAQRFGAAFEALAGFKGVSIAALNGHAMGGGLECALVCDFRIAAAHVQMGLPEASVGLLPCAGGTQWLARTVGESWAKRMILLGERVDATTALRIGLVDAITDAGDAALEAVRWAEKVERQSSAAVAASKALMHAARSHSPQAVLPQEREYFVALFDGADAREGVHAFLQKRPPQWCNR